MAIIDGTYRDERYGQAIYNLLMTHFHNDIGVSGLMGNLQAESYLTPYRMQSELSESADISRSYATDVVQGNITKSQFIAKDQDSIWYHGVEYDGVGFGLAQWTYFSRKEALYDWRISNEFIDFGVNCTVSFLIHELSTNYPECYDMVMNGTNLKAVSDYILANFENPGDQSTEMKLHRYRLAAAILNDYGGHTPVIISTKKTKYPWVLFK